MLNQAVGQEESSHAHQIEAIGSGMLGFVIGKAFV
jgi:hypothetical protein